MPESNNIKQARTLIYECPVGTVSKDVVLLWLVEVAYFLLSRYVDQK